MPICMEHPILLALGGKMMQKSYFQMTLKRTIRQTQQMDNRLFATYTNIFFIPMDDFGVRLLRIITVPNWPERIMKGLFKPEVRSYGRGSFTYDAYDNGVYFLSFLDGDLWRLFASGRQSWTGRVLSGWFASRSRSPF